MLESPGEPIDLPVVERWPRTSESEAEWVSALKAACPLLPQLRLPALQIVLSVCYVLGCLHPQENQGIWGWEGVGNGSISMESLLELYPGFMELGDTGKAAFLTAELLNSFSLSHGVPLAHSSHLAQ